MTLPGIMFVGERSIQIHVGHGVANVASPATSGLRLSCVLLSGEFLYGGKELLDDVDGTLDVAQSQTSGVGVVGSVFMGLVC